MLQITFEDFVALFDGTSVDFDNFYGDQCVDEVQFWARILGYPRFTGNAQDLYNQAGDNYTQIPNTPEGVPQKGDIVVWSDKFNGTVGHVGISTGIGDTNSFEVFEQNDPSSGICHKKTYTYFAVLGWLRPKQMPQNQQDLINQLRAERDKNWDSYQEEIKKLNALQQQFDLYKSSHPDQPIENPSTPLPSVPNSPEAPENPTQKPNPTIPPVTPSPTLKNNILFKIIQWLIEHFITGQNVS